MSEASPDRDDEMLARLAEFDLAAAERVHGRLMAAEEASEIAELGRTYQRVARSLRQTLALKAKLKHDREAAAKAAPPATPSPSAMSRRARELREAVTRVIWSEAESPDAGVFLEGLLDEGIAEEMLSDDFCAEALDAHVAQVCEELGLSPEGAAGWRGLADPPAAGDEPEDAPPDGDPAASAPHRSSG
jgi:hypothetical protein